MSEFKEASNSFKQLPHCAGKLYDLLLVKWSINVILIIEKRKIIPVFLLFLCTEHHRHFNKTPNKI